MSRPVVTQILLASLTGLLYPLCFPGFDFGWLAWFVLIPLHLAVEEASPRRAFWIGWLAGLIAFIGTISWVITAMHLYGRLPLAVSLLVMLLLATYLGLYLGIYTLAMAWLNKTGLALVFLGAPCFWVALELLRTHLLSGFPWVLLGYSQYRWLHVIQVADITSVYGLSFLIVLVNIALATTGRWALSRTQGTHPLVFPWPAPTAALLGLALALTYGTVKLNSDSSQSDRSQRLKIGLVQANIDQGHKWDPSYQQETLNRYTQLTQQVAESTDLVIWPEAATPFLFEREPGYQAVVTTLVEQVDTPLLFGSPLLQFFPNGRPYLFNSAYLLTADGRLAGRYDKRHLVPFGEYIPLRSILFFLDKLVEGIGDFKAGTSPKLLTLPTQADQSSVRFGVAICFEVIFPNLVRDLAYEGAHFLVTITNDAWFGESVAPYQHFGMVVFRAVENRIAFARAANTGISGFIAPDGRILTATPIFTQLSTTGQIPIRTSTTFYTQYGDVFAWACVIITGALFILAHRRDNSRATKR